MKGQNFRAKDESLWSVAIKVLSSNVESRDLLTRPNQMVSVVAAFDLQTLSTLTLQGSFEENCVANAVLL